MDADQLKQTFAEYKKVRENLGGGHGEHGERWYEFMVFDQKKMAPDTFSFAPFTWEEDYIAFRKALALKDSRAKEFYDRYSLWTMTK